MSKLFAYIHIAILLSLLSIHSNTAQAYKIDVKIKDIADTILIIGYHMDGKMLAKDTTEINSKGEGSFIGDEKLPGGMYFLFFPQQNIFNFLLGDDQEFSIETTQEKPNENPKIKGSLENELFFGYEKFINEKSEQAKTLREKYKNTSDKDEKQKIDDQISAISKDVNNEIDRIISEYPELFIATFLKATKQVDVPDPPESLSKEEKQKFNYYYYKNHYFDNFDFSDARIIRTPFFKDKIINYFEKTIHQNPDSINKEADKVIQKAKANEETYKYVLGTLYNTYNNSQIMGQDAVFVHLADYYLRGEAAWADTSFTNKLQKRVSKVRPTLIGNKAANFQAITDDKYLVDMHKLKANYLLLIFYDAACSHCKKAVPQLHKVYERLKHVGVGAVGFYTQGDSVKWKEFIEKNNLKWVNVWSPHSNYYRQFYDVYDVPKIYVLDKDKKIMAKRLAEDQIERVILEDMLRTILKEIDFDDVKKRILIYKRFMQEFHDEETIKIIKDIVLLHPMDEEYKEIITKFADDLIQNIQDNNPEESEINKQN